MSIRTEIKNKESQIINWWNKKGKGQIQLVSDDYCTYDFEGENVIVEVKHRFKAYDTKMIETMKLSNNYQQSQIKGKTFIYIVVDEKKIMKLHRNLPKKLSVLWEQDYQQEI